MDNFSPHKCLQCGKAIVGRADKRFCDAYCRNSFNNQNKSTDERHINWVNAAIRKNRRILKTLCPEGKATVRRDVLDMMGFDYRFISGLFQTNSGPYYLCYDLGYKPIEERSQTDGAVVQKVLIIKKQQYMDQPAYDPWKYLG